MKITQCQGNGQGSCKRCDDKGIWNRHWSTMLYKIDGLDGCYCSKCVKEIEEEETRERTRKNYEMQFGKGWH